MRYEGLNGEDLYSLFPDHTCNCKELLSDCLKLLQKLDLEFQKVA
jgi:hypothetical protein